MRRRLGILLPSGVFAVLVQLMAPIAAFRVVAAAATDPLYRAAMCSGLASSADSQTAPARTAHDDGACCAVCAAGHGGTAAVAFPPEPVFVSLQRHYQTVSWLEADVAQPSVRAGSNTQARAPPLSA